MTNMTYNHANNSRNILKRNRRTRTWAAAVLLALQAPVLTSCGNFLEIAPLETIVLEKFWNEETDVENVVAGCYAAMQDQTVVSRMMAWGEFRSDNIVGGTGIENNLDLSNIFKENINASNSFLKWGEFYNIINRCNTVLYYAPSVAEKDPNYTQSELRATEAEVTAIRALMYFYLIRTFRDVPYVTEPYLDDNQQLAIPATPFAEVLGHLISDLERVQDYAVRKYPTTKNYYQRGRITQDAIHAMLCDMYLWQQDYQNAVRYADMVIQAKTADYEAELNRMSGVISANQQMIDGYPIISDAYATGNYYGNAFIEIFSDGNSRESILELIYMEDDQMPANGAVSNYYGNSENTVGSVRPADFLMSDINDELFTVFENKYDARFYENMQPVTGSKTLAGINKYANRSVMINLGKAELEGTYGSAYARDHCHANWILYRLTDVMLMKAEALVEMGSPEQMQQAFDIVNTVYKRSNCSATDKNLDPARYSVTNQDVMRDLVLLERQRELMFEGKRWYDLVRRSLRDGNTGKLAGRVALKGSGGSTAISSKLSSMDAIFWPYHIDELDVNEYLTQNPAFGSGENSSIELTQ